MDYTYKGIVILSSRVTIGEPVQKSALLWSVPYDVIDDAGNKAVTAWRDVVVEEVDFFDIEAKIRSEVMREKEAEIQKAVEAARRKDRENGEQVEVVNVPTETKQRLSSSRPSCPPCAKCDCPENTFDQARCEAYCRSKMESCAIQEEGILFRLIHWLENVFPTSVASSIILSILSFGLFFALKLVLTLLLNPQAFTGYDFASAEREGPASGNVQYYRSPPPASAGMSASGNAGYSQTNTAPEPYSSNGLFSPLHQPSTASPFLSPPQNNGNVPSMPSSSAASARQEYRYDEDDIYETIITPSRTGDGVKRRKPYGNL